MRCLVLLFIVFSFLGCGGSCLGYFAPGANLYVRNAQTGELITNAHVIINSIGDDEMATNQALYVSEDDGLSNSEQGAYYTTIGINASNWMVNFTVSADGYQSFDSADYEFIQDTSCMAENNFVQEVFLCPVGEICD